MRFKGQIPIIIALVIVLAILISTTLYVSTIPVHVSSNYYGKQLSQWDILDQQLNMLQLVIIKKCGANIANYVLNYINTQYNEYYDRIPVDIILYNSFTTRVSKSSSTNTFYTGVPIGYKLNSIYYPNEYITINENNFVSLLSKLSILATEQLNTSAYDILINWAKWISHIGYRVIVNYFNSSYIMKLSIFSGKAVGSSVLSVNFTVTLINQEGDFKTYNKEYVVSVSQEFSRGYTWGNGYVFPVLYKAYIYQNGQYYYYMLSPSNINVKISSMIFNLLPSFYTLNGQGKWISAKIIGSFYKGSGYTNLTFIIPYTSMEQYVTDWEKYIFLAFANSLYGTENQSISIEQIAGYTLVSNYTSSFSPTISLGLAEANTSVSGYLYGREYIYYLWLGIFPILLYSSPFIASFSGSTIVYPGTTSVSYPTNITDLYVTFSYSYSYSIDGVNETYTPLLVSLFNITVEYNRTIDFYIPMISTVNVNGIDIVVPCQSVLRTNNTFIFTYLPILGSWSGISLGLSQRLTGS